YVWNTADCALPVTEVLARYVRDAGVPGNRITVIHNGIDLKHFDRAPTNREARLKLGLSARLVLGFVGFVRAWHGLDKVIEFLTLEPAEDLHLLVVGDGP